MSFLDTGKLRLDWIAAGLVRGSVRPETGCVQCGNRLEMNERGKYDASGKCFNCNNWVSDEDEETEELDC